MENGSEGGRGQEGRNGVSGRTRRGDEADEARGMFVSSEDGFGEEGRRDDERAGE